MSAEPGYRPRKRRPSSLASAGGAARELAVAVLGRVHRDGAFASVALDQELSRQPALDPRDRALATELVYGCLRTHGWLHAELLRFAKRGFAASDVVGLHLAVAAYQVLFLSRTPAHAAVDIAVAAVSKQRGAKVGGFVNAVLRQLARSKASRTLDDAVVASAPPWLWQRVVAAIGEREARLLLTGPGADETPASSANSRTSTTIRLRGPADECELPWLRGATAGRFLAATRRLYRAGDPRELEGYPTGAFVVQEEGSQLCAAMLGALAGERVLDACAGEGRKASILAEAVGTPGTLWVSDVFARKLDTLASEFGRLGLPLPQRAIVDWTVGPGEIPADFDRVLIDAPCSGVGTIWRRPDILLRLTSARVEESSRRAVQVLRRAGSRARAGGRVLYVVCSVLTEECEDVLRQVADVLEPVPFDAPLSRQLTPNGEHQLRLLPGQHGTDGFFLAMLRRV